MNMKRIHLLIPALAVTLLHGISVAQTPVTMYYDMPALFNPAAAGSAGLFSFSAGGVISGDNSHAHGNRFMATAIAPFRIAGRDFGAGIMVDNDNSHPLRTTDAGIMLNFAMHVFGGELRGGFGAGYTASRIFATVPDSNPDAGPEPERTFRLKSNAVDINGGIFFTGPRLWGGLSVLHANSPEYDFGNISMESSSAPPESTSEETTPEETETSNITVRRKPLVIAMAGYDIDLGRNLNLLPSAMLRSGAGHNIASVTARLRYRGIVSLGASWCNARSLSALASVRLGRMSIGYAYSHQLGKQARARGHNGNHEIIASYSIPVSFTKKPASQHKSIRIM